MNGLNQRWKNTDCFLWCGVSGALQVSFQRPQNESDYLQNGTAVTLQWCLLGAALQIISSAWPNRLDNVPCLVALSTGEFPSTLLISFIPLGVLSLPQAVDHPRGKTIPRLPGDTAECNMATAVHFKTGLTTDTLKRGNHLIWSGGSYFEGGNSEELVNASVFLQ